MTVRWSLVVSDATDRSLRSYLARTGGRKGDLSRFVDRAVRQAIFWESLDSVRERNRHLSAADAQALADDAVARARADRA
ncbi:MAG: methionine repressor-like protein [Rhodospirillaceae bacterium]|nr:methionine repressor-like protein [Rhodospirillaceae bacterium]